MPDSAVTPLHAPLALQEFASVVVQVSLTFAPTTTDVLSIVRFTVGGSTAGGVGVGAGLEAGGGVEKTVCRVLSSAFSRPISAWDIAQLRHLQAHQIA